MKELEIETIKEKIQKLRKEENIKIGPISQSLSDEGVFYILINRRWKYAKSMNLKVTDLEEAVSLESGIYLKEWIAEVFFENNFQQSNSIPFPDWNVLKRNVNKLIRN